MDAAAEPLHPDSIGALLAGFTNVSMSVDTARQLGLGEHVTPEIVSAGAARVSILPDGTATLSPWT